MGELVRLFRRIPAVGHQSRGDILGRAWIPPVARPRVRSVGSSFGLPSTKVETEGERSGLAAGLHFQKCAGPGPALRKCAGPSAARQQPGGLPPFQPSFPLVRTRTPYPPQL